MKHERVQGMKLTLQAIVIGVLVVVLFSGVLIEQELTHQDRSFPASASHEVAGEFSVTVIPVIFQGIAPNSTSEELARVISENMSAYFYAQSYGRVWMSGRALDWREVPGNSEYYSDNRDGLTRDALGGVCWTAGNYTEQVFVVYSGGRTVRPGHYYSWSVQVDGAARSVGVSIVPELDDFSAWLHEMGHGLGLHDYYCDDEYAKTYLGEFVGWFALMAYGDHYGVPADMCGYSKIALGWLTDDEILDVNDETRCTLLGLSEQGVGVRIARVRIDEMRQYVVEARTNRGQDSGVLISLVDRTRGVDGFGRLEVVRSNRGFDGYSFDGAAFRVGESFRDTIHGIEVSVVGRSGTGFSITVNMEFSKEPIEARCPLGFPGGAEEAVAMTLRNGTSYMAVCVSEQATLAKSIVLFRFDGSFRVVSRTPTEYDCFHPVLVEGLEALALIYEFRSGEKHGIAAQLGNTMQVLSGTDDARSPVVRCSYSEMWIAYENHTGFGNEIVVLKAWFSWSDAISVERNPAHVVRPTEGHVLSRPQLFGHEWTILSYHNSTSDGDFIELRWKLLSTELVAGPSIPADQMQSYAGLEFGPWWKFISVARTDEGRSFTNVHFMSLYNSELIDVGTFSGELISPVSLMGLWLVQDHEGEVELTRVWNRHRENDQTLTHHPTGTTVSAGLMCIDGSPALFLLTDELDALTLSYWFITSCPSAHQYNTTPPYYRPFVIVYGTVACVVVVFFRFGHRQDIHSAGA